VVVVALCTVLVTAAPAGASTVKIGGTGAIDAALESIQEAYRVRYPETRIVVVHGLGGRGGKKALLAGAIEIAVAADSIGEEDRRGGLDSMPWVKTPFVFASAPGTTMSGLTSRQVAEIYAGQMVTWPDGSRLRLILRPPQDSDNQSLRSMSRGMSVAVDQALARTGMIMAATDQEAASALESIPGAVGTATLGLLLSERREVSVLSIDGVRPTVNSMVDGSYPYSKTLHLVFRADVSPAGRRFIAFAVSPAVQSLLRSRGFHLLLAVPVPLR
jgi:phosphate transport system substrate-binding protein